MLKIEKTEVYGWDVAITGMRNPFNSWDKIDSYYGCEKGACVDCKEDWFHCHGLEHELILGENDLKLMKKLSNAGSDHSKYLRMINVTCDITAPLYWWKEFDTYKVGTVANSCSTMHTIHKKEFTLDDFSSEHLFLHEDYPLITMVDTREIEYNVEIGSVLILQLNIIILNYYREKFIETKDKKYWWQIIQLLPSSYNQKRTVQMNYQVLKNMYHARKNHKLDEWQEFCKWCEELPYFKEICVEVK